MLCCFMHHKYTEQVLATGLKCNRKIKISVNKERTTLSWEICVESKKGTVFGSGNIWQFVLKRFKVIICFICVQFFYWSFCQQNLWKGWKIIYPDIDEINLHWYKTEKNQQKEFLLEKLLKQVINYKMYVLVILQLWFSVALLSAPCFSDD